MDDLDEYDVTESFRALDQGRDGTISVQDLQVLYLGLGFQPERRTVEELENEVRQHHADTQKIPLTVVLQVLSHYTRNRNEELQKAFRLLDSGNKGHLTPEDVQKLAKEVTGHELSDGQAARMLEFYSGEAKLSNDEFRNLFSPPEP